LLKVTLNTINLTLTVRKSFDKHILWWRILNTIYDEVH
jgi:hypothetical protein